LLVLEILLLTKKQEKRKTDMEVIDELSDSADPTPASPCPACVLPLIWTGPTVLRQDRNLKILTQAAFSLSYLDPTLKMC
jgi:hypothetical protein